MCRCVSTGTVYTTVGTTVGTYGAYMYVHYLTLPLRTTLELPRYMKFREREREREREGLYSKPETKLKTKKRTKKKQ